MRRLLLIVSLLLAAMLFANGQESSKPGSKREDTKSAEAAASAPKPLSYYRLDFVVNELDDGKKTNSRSYTMLVESPGRADFKVGSRVPVPAGGGSVSGAGLGGFSYMDVGINFNRIDIQERESMLIVDVVGDISNLAASDQGVQSPPLIRSARFGGPSVVAPGKPTILFSLDDVNSKHRFQIELTATKLK